MKKVFILFSIIISVLSVSCVGPEFNYIEIPRKKEIPETVVTELFENAKPQNYFHDTVLDGIPLGNFNTFDNEFFSVNLYESFFDKTYVMDEESSFKTILHCDDASVDNSYWLIMECQDTFKSRSPTFDGYHITETETEFDLAPLIKRFYCDNNHFPETMYIDIFLMAEDDFYNFYGDGSGYLHKWERMMKYEGDGFIRTKESDEYYKTYIEPLPFKTKTLEGYSSKSMKIHFTNRCRDRSEMEPIGLGNLSFFNDSTKGCILFYDKMEEPFFARQEYTFYSCWWAKNRETFDFLDPAEMNVIENEKDGNVWYIYGEKYVNPNSSLYEKYDYDDIARLTKRVSAAGLDGYNYSEEIELELNKIAYGKVKENYLGIQYFEPVWTRELTDEEKTSALEYMNSLYNTKESVVRTKIIE